MIRWNLGVGEIRKFFVWESEVNSAIVVDFAHLNNLKTE
jgi:hypothetical protein